MSTFFDQAAEDRSARGSDELDERAAKWLVGDRLSFVLHMGDGALAYRLSDQGHEVVVAGDDVRTVRQREVLYLRTAGERLPFAGGSFDAIVVPQLQEAPTALAEYARVLRPGGLLSTLTRSYDESIPWMRRLLQIIDRPTRRHAPVDTFGASGLFDEPETTELATWEKLDLPGLLAFARAVAPAADEASLARVHELFNSNTAQTGHLRLRALTHCVRARVLKEDVQEPAPPPDTLLLDFR